MDAVFGAEQFRTQVTWRRTNAKGLAFKGYPNNADFLLYYSKGDDFNWNRPFRPHDPTYVDKFYRHVEPETGRRYQLADLVNPNQDRPNLTYEFLGVTRVWRWTKERMQAAYDEGLVVQQQPGSVPRLKRYLDEMKGNTVDTIWDDIRPIQARSPERTGYPTQKPLAPAGAHHLGIIQPRRHGARPLRGVRHGLRSRREAGQAMGRHRPVPEGRRACEPTPPRLHGRPVPRPARHGPHGHPTPHGHRRADQLPQEQARSLRSSRKGAATAARPSSPTGSWKSTTSSHAHGGGTDHMDNLATALFALQPHQGGPATGVFGSAVGGMSQDAPSRRIRIISLVVFLILLVVNLFLFNYFDHRYICRIDADGVCRVYDE